MRASCSCSWRVNSLSITNEEPDRIAGRELFSRRRWHELAEWTTVLTQGLQEVVHQANASSKPERLNLCIQPLAIVDSGLPLIEHVGSIGIKDALMCTCTSMDGGRSLRCRQVRT